MSYTQQTPPATKTMLPIPLYTMHAHVYSYETVFFMFCFNLPQPHNKGMSSDTSIKLTLNPS